MTHIASVFAPHRKVWSQAYTGVIPRHDHPKKTSSSSAAAAAAAAASSVAASPPSVHHTRHRLICRLKAHTWTHFATRLTHNSLGPCSPVRPCRFLSNSARACRSNRRRMAPSISALQFLTTSPSSGLRGHSAESAPTHSASPTYAGDGCGRLVPFALGANRGRDFDRFAFQTASYRPNRVHSAVQGHPGSPQVTSGQTGLGEVAQLPW